jgi:hypothetical protein
MATIGFPDKNSNVITGKFGSEDFYTPVRVTALLASMVKKYGAVQGPIEAQKRIDAYNNLKGIYQIKHYGGKRYNVKEKFYFPGSVNPLNPSPEQIASQQKFADGVLAWQNLTPYEQGVYNLRGSKKALPGYNLFLREYMKN